MSGLHVLIKVLFFCIKESKMKSFVMLKQKNNPRPALSPHRLTPYLMFWPFEPQLHLGFNVHRPITQFGVGMKSDEEALVILTIFVDQYPFIPCLLLLLR